jgi:hypothetical protein
MDNLENLTISDNSTLSEMTQAASTNDTLSEKLLAEVKLCVRPSSMNWKYLKRIHAMVQFISKQENLSIEDQLVARMWVFIKFHTIIVRNILSLSQMDLIESRLKQNPLMEQIISDAEHLDNLGTIGITKNPNLELEQFVAISEFLKTHTAICIGESRMKIIKEFIILREMESAGSDFYPQCDVCFQRSYSNIDFLPCHHAFCSECFFGPYGTAYCTICDKTFFDESPKLLSQQVDFS